MRNPTRRAGAGRIATVSLALALISSMFAARAGAVPASPQDSVRSFYDVLLATMKNGRSLGQSGRYAALAPAVSGVFDVPLMTRLAVGPAWARLTAAQQQEIVAAFGRYVAATYADRFDSYSGQRLEVTGAEPYAAGVIVDTRIVDPGADPVSINYLMRRNGDAWQIADVYLDGTISQLATQRSEFQSILARQGVDGLIMTLNRKVDLLTSDAGKSP